MLESRLQRIKLELNTLALEQGIDYDEVIKYLNGYELRPKKINILESEKALSENDIIKIRGRHEVKKNVMVFVEKQNIENKDSQKIQHQKLIENTHDTLQNSLIKLNRIYHTVLDNVMELMVTKKVYKIRQNFREVILNILGIQDLCFYAYHQNGRIQSHQFSSNLITEILESDVKCRTLQKIINTISDEFNIIEFSDNSEFMSLFQVSPSRIERGFHFGTTFKWYSGQNEESLMVCVMIKTSEYQTISGISNLLNPKILKKIIEISLIQISESNPSNISKLYVNKMLDLLEILTINCSGMLMIKLCEIFNISAKNYYGITNLIRIITNTKINKDYCNQQLIYMIKCLSEKFEETQYLNIEEIRIYKKYVCEDNQVFMEFNKAGKLLFLSGNKDNLILNQLNQIWEPEKPILFEIFKGNLKLDIHCKKVLRGNSSDRKFEIARDVTARIISSKRKINKIQIIIENLQQSNSFGSKDSETKFKTPRKIPDIISNATIKLIQEQHPDISRQGWLDLFLKNGRTNQRYRSEKKKNKTYIKQGFQVPVRQMARRRNHSLDVQLNYVLQFSGEDIQSPNFNVLELNDEDLQIFAYQVLNSLEYSFSLNKNKDKMCNFLADLHEQYEFHSNSFHNFRHGINVMHTCYILSNLPSNDNILSQQDIFTIIFSGLCHDVGHTGFTNSFQIASGSKKALVYNDKSPLENFHASLTFEILRKQSNNFLVDLSPEQFSKFRKDTIENILFTDIKEHFPLLNKFQTLIESKKKITKDDASLLSCMIVHSSDFGGSIKNFNICRQWSTRVNAQFSQQYKKQGELGLPQTPYMKDLSNLSVMSKGECGFLKIIVYPLYQALNKMYLTENIVHQYKRNIQNSIKEWNYIYLSEIAKEEEKKVASNEGL